MDKVWVASRIAADHAKDRDEAYARSLRNA